MSDYIKRDDALDIVAHNCVNGEITLNIYAIDGIYEIPPADVTLVKHGRWYKDDQDKLLMRIRCSICNKAIYSENHFAYCPNCGARMDGENDETDRR